MCSSYLLAHAERAAAQMCDNNMADCMGFIKNNESGFTVKHYFCL